jgi:hypothetical protein
MSDAIKGNILTPAGWVHGEITFDERIAAITAAASIPRSTKTSISCLALSTCTCTAAAART